MNSNVFSANGLKSLHIPEVFTVSMLKSLGALPKKTCGSLCAELFQVPFEDILFAISLDDKVTSRDSFIVNDCDTYYLDELYNYSQLNPAKRIFVCPGSMGDVVYALGSVNALSKHYDEEIIFVCHEIYHDLVRASTAPSQCWDINFITNEQVFEMEVSRKAGLLHNLGGWADIVAPRHMTDAFIEVVNDNININNIDKTNSISITDDEIRDVDLFIKDNFIDINDKVVVLHPNIGSPNRTWTEKGWGELANKFITDGWKVIFIGSNKNKYTSKVMMDLDVGDIIDARDKFSILQTVYFMKYCQLLVSCDSGPVALAGLTDIAIFGIYSIIPSKYRLPYRHGSIGWNSASIDVRCQFGQCGHLIMDKPFFKNKLKKEYVAPTGDKFSDWCVNNAKYTCMKKLTSDFVWSSIVDFLKSDKYKQQKMS